ncbi:hypothetical protein PG995_004509 [Apiospora arundinis]
MADLGRPNGYHTLRDSMSTPLLDVQNKLGASLSSWELLCSAQIDQRSSIRLRVWHLSIAVFSFALVLVHAVSVNPFGQAYDPEDEDTNDELTTALTEYMVDINFAAFSFFWFSILFAVSFMSFMHFAHYTSRPAHLPRVTAAALCVLVDTYIFLNSTSIIDIDHDDVKNKRAFIAGIILTGVFDILVVLDMTISLVCTLAGVHKLALFATSAI